jgi:hypothetical protein
MNDELKRLVEAVEAGTWNVVLQPAVIQDGRTSANPVQADASHIVRNLCAAVRELDAENERARALLSNLIAVDERGTLGNLATRQQAFGELGDIVAAARNLLGSDKSEQPIPGTHGETVIAAGTTEPSHTSLKRVLLGR